MPTKATTIIFEEDAAIATMSEKAIEAEVLAMFGSWADRDDITDNYLDDLRGGWGTRLDELYGNDEEDLSI